MVDNLLGALHLEAAKGPTSSGMKSRVVLEKSWPSPIRDWQDENFERQEQYSGGIGMSIAGDKYRRYPAGLATKTRVLMMTARLGNEDEGTEAPIQAKAAEVARITPTWQGPVAENHRELSAGDDDDRHLPGH